jgi:hypothetical protein
MEAAFKKNRPNLSAGSLRTYCSILKNLGKALEVSIESPADIIKNYKKILTLFKDLSPNVRKTRLSSLVVFIEGEKDATEALDAFRKCMAEDRKAFEEDQDNQVKSDRQEEGMIPYEEVMQHYSTYEKQIASLLKKPSLDKQEFSKVQMYVLLSCLLLIEPRRSLDYTAFKIRNVDEGKDNYMRLVKKQPQFVFNQYKTAKKYKQQCEDIPLKLYKIVDAWKKQNPYDWLLMNYKQSGPISSPQVTAMLYNFFDKPISTSMLRHIFLTHKFKDLPSIHELQETAHKMGHDMGTMLRYIKQDDPEPMAEPTAELAPKPKRKSKAK